jgi:hypothetical protein
LRNLRQGRARLAQPLPAIAAYQVPATRLRLFVMAFVLAFGFETWGISALQAQVLKPGITALRDPKNLQSALSDADSNEVVLRGRVLDVYTREPVAYANVMAFSAGKLVSGTLSDTAGDFELRFPKQSIQGETYQLRLRYQGREREDLDITADIRSFVYLIDASFMVEGLEVQEMRSRFEWEDPIIMGQLITTTECDFSWRSLPSTGTTKALYRPLDEWLMMNNSEIHHSGRW